MFHYTDTDGFKAIASQVVWWFKAYVPAGPHPEGAYFTTLPPGTRNLARRIRVPIWKLEQVLEFVGNAELVALDGGKGRGEYVFYCPNDYHVDVDRQRYRGPTCGYPLETRS